MMWKAQLTWATTLQTLEVTTRRRTSLLLLPAVVVVLVVGVVGVGEAEGRTGLGPLFRSRVRPALALDRAACVTSGRSGTATR